MIVLPTILDKVIPHKAHYVTKGDRFVPDPAYDEFWDALYSLLSQSGFFSPPVRNFEKKINPYFGRFGPRWDLEKYEKGSYHNGLDIEGRRKTGVRAVADGVLEYAGYGVINGKYVMLSHPSVVTEDGCVLHSLYMHLNHFDLSFNSYQKMLRQISMNTYPVVKTKKDQLIGGIGKTGISGYLENYTHLHFQMEFVCKDGAVVFIDSARIFGLPSMENLTAGLTTGKQFLDVYLKNRKDIYNRKLQDIWLNYKESRKK